MDKNTFGSSEEMKSLVAITNLIQLLDKKKKNHVGNFVSIFNRRIKSVDTIIDYGHKGYVLNLIKLDYFNMLSELDRIGKYDPILITHLKCFVDSKIKITLRKHLANEFKNKQQ